MKERACKVIRFIARWKITFFCIFCALILDAGSVFSDSQARSDGFVGLSFVFIHISSIIIIYTFAQQAVFRKKGFMWKIALSILALFSYISVAFSAAYRMVALFGISLSGAFTNWLLATPVAEMPGWIWFCIVTFRILQFAVMSVIPIFGGIFVIFVFGLGYKWFTKTFIEHR